MKHRIQIDADFDDVIYGLCVQGYSVVKDAILQLDESQQDADFTMQVITELAQRLRLELDSFEIKEFLKSLRKKCK